MLEVAAANAGMADRGRDLLLRRASGQAFYNTSQLDFPMLLDDANNVAGNLRSYIGGFSAGATEVLEKYAFDEQIGRLDNAALLYLVTAKFADINLHPDRIENLEMGYIFEELVRRFSEQSNETAGEHFTPRRVGSLREPPDAALALAKSEQYSARCRQRAGRSGTSWRAAAMMSCCDSSGKTRRK